jgi:hypothetical protein
MAFAVSWDFSLRFDSGRNRGWLLSSPKRRDDVTRPEFVREMRESLAEQKRKADQDQREKLLDADVIKQQGMKKWEELSGEVGIIAKEISINFWPAEGYSFILNNGTRKLTVSLDGAVRYKGVEQGSFEYVVRGSELMFSARPKVSSGYITATVGEVGQALTVEEVAELLVRMVVSRS